MKPIIRVEGLGKRYYIGGSRAPYRTLRETLLGLVGSALRRAEGPRARQELWALDDLSFEVMPGEVLGVVGRNGAGKSTLLKILSRITHPTAGRVELCGRVGSLLEVGSGFHPELTGRENIFLNGAVLGMRRQEIRQRFDEIVEFAEIERFIDTPVKRYSSGMYTRLAFAVAAHLDTEILLVDEVLAVGDSEFQKKCLQKMGRVAGEGRTILFVSHNMSAAANLCTKGLLLRGGRAVMSGGIGEVIDEYLAHARLAEVKFEDQVLRHATVRERDDGIEISCAYRVDRAIALPCLGFVISDVMGNPICGSNAKEDLAKAPEEPTRAGRVGVLVRTPRLREGTYRVSLWFGDGHDSLFHMRDCLVFEVVPKGDHGRISPRIGGPVVTDCRWSFGDEAGGLVTRPKG